MSCVIKGAIHVTGWPDVGKTTFALECGAPPDEIVFFDDDLKGRITIEEFGTEKFGRYVDLIDIEAQTKSLREYHMRCLDIIESIQQGQYSALVWDTWSRFARTCQSYVVTHASKFRDRSEWSKSGKIHGAEQWKEARKYEARIISEMTAKVRTVILITHLKSEYLNDAATGRRIPASSRALERVCRARIFLTQNPTGRPVPVGLFLKRFDRKEYVPNTGMRTINIVPRKVVPRPGDRSLWDTIGYYVENPFGDHRPSPDQMPNEFEVSIIDGVMTKDQKHVFEQMLRAGAVRADGDDAIPFPPAPGSWQDLLTETGLSLQDIGGIDQAKSMTQDDIDKIWAKHHGEW